MFFSQQGHPMALPFYFCCFIQLCRLSMVIDEKRGLLLLLTLSMLLVLSAAAHAGLMNIGTACYDSDGDGIDEIYILIYETGGPFGPITWLDFPMGTNSWQTQVDWTSGLGVQLTVTLDPG
jgi:hypothetical protein